MTKLYPPVVKGSLPAFSLGDDKIYLRIPFSLGRTTSPAQVKKMAIMIKSVSTGVVLTPSTRNNKIFYDYSSNISFENYENVVTFEFAKNSKMGQKFQEGQYYKILLAFVKDNNTSEEGIGHFSTVGIIKCIAKPNLSILSNAASMENDELASETNSETQVDLLQPNYEYIGIYKLSFEAIDRTENVLKYRFDLKDSKGNIVDTSGEQLHDSTQDKNSDETIDKWFTAYDMSPYEKYTLTYSVETINGWVGSTTVNLFSVGTIDIDISVDFQAKLDYENGCVELWLIEDNIKNLPWISYNFLVSRASSKDNYLTWEPICKDSPTLHLKDANANNLLFWIDYTVELGVKYKYALLAYNGYGLYSNRIESNRDFDLDSQVFSKQGNPILVDFEDAFLFDGIRLLKLRFNPKITSFKNTVLESKIDTIGGKYPFIFRNGNVTYKEFPISALISLLGDPNDKFQTSLFKINNSTRHTTPAMALDFDNSSTDVTSNNIYRERLFKMEVLEWLTNGEPKIFRSSSEGNYIVRLMNTSLTPTDTVGRMLHTFSSTAYEIATFNFNNLREYGFVDLDFTKVGLIPLIRQIFLYEQGGVDGTLSTEVDLSSARYIKLNSRTSPTKKISRVKISYQNSAEDKEIYFKGVYEIKQLEKNPVMKIEVIEGDIEIIYLYFVNNIETNFDLIVSITPHSCFSLIIGSQLFEPVFNNENEYVYLGQYKCYNYKPSYIIANPNNPPTYVDSEGKIQSYDILLNTASLQVAYFEWLRIYRRPIERRWKKNDIYYKNINCLPGTEENFEFLPTLIYEICEVGSFEPLGYFVDKDLFISVTDWELSNPYLVRLGSGTDASSEFYLGTTNFEMTNRQLAEYLYIDRYEKGMLEGKYAPLPNSPLGHITTETNIDSIKYTDLSSLYIGPGLIAEIKYIVKEYIYDADISLPVKPVLNHEPVLSYIHNCYKEYLKAETQESKKYYEKTIISLLQTFRRLNDLILKLQNYHQKMKLYNSDLLIALELENLPDEMKGELKKDDNAV